MNMDSFFTISEKFRSFDDLRAKVSRYEKETFVKLWKRDSRTVQAAKKRMTKHLSNDIKYYEVTYACIHGGKKFKPRGKGQRQTS